MANFGVQVSVCKNTTRAKLKRIVCWHRDSSQYISVLKKTFIYALTYFFSLCTLSVLLWPDCLDFAFCSLLYNTQNTNIYAPGGIRTRNPNKRSAIDPRLRTLGRWDRHVLSYKWIRVTTGPFTISDVGRGERVTHLAKLMTPNSCLTSN